MRSRGLEAALLIVAFVLDHAHDAELAAATQAALAGQGQDAFTTNL